MASPGAPAVRRFDDLDALTRAAADELAAIWYGWSTRRRPPSEIPS